MIAARWSGTTEGPTLGLIVAVSIGIPLLAAIGGSTPALWLSMPLLSLMLVLQSSLQHEVLHGHPTSYPLVNEALVCVPFGLFIPYQRFRDTHLAHHHDARLTDPYDDPETNYLDPDVWRRTPFALRVLFAANNCLLGRMTIGPLISTLRFYRSETLALLSGDRAVWRAWLLHAAGSVPLLWWLVGHTDLPLWAYLASAYGALSVLKVRTYLEHQAHALVPGRTAIVEDRGPLSWLFLNNNLHLVHHLHPRAPWYRLPAIYRQRRADFLRRNGGYCYPHYLAVFDRHLLTRKDPVAHPLSVGA